MLYSQELVLGIRLLLDKDQIPSLTMRLVVIVMLLADTVASSIQLVHVYGLAITHWGDLAFIASSAFPFEVPAFCFLTGVSGAICQFFLIRRVFRLTHNWFVTVPLLCTATATVAGSILTGFAYATNGGDGDASLALHGGTLWLAALAVTVSFSPSTISREQR